MSNLIFQFRDAFWLGVVLLLVGALQGNAHEQKTALTDIFFNERTGNLEIAHRFRIHDAEHTLRRAMDLQADLIQSPDAQSTFADYVVARFGLRREDGSVIELSLVGQELEGGYLWVYQETEIPTPVNASFSIRNGILFDVVKGQRNTVNVRSRSRVSSFLFEEGSGEKLYDRLDLADR